MKPTLLFYILSLFSIEYALSIPVDGFEFLDDHSEDFVAKDLVRANVNFSPNLSLCIWHKPTWIRKRK